MKTSWLVAGAALGLMSSPTADAFHANSQGGLPRGARGRATRGGQSLDAASGFDLGDWLKQAFNPPTAAAVKKRARWVRDRRTPFVQFGNTQRKIEREKENWQACRLRCYAVEVRFGFARTCLKQWEAGQVLYGGGRGNQAQARCVYHILHNGTASHECNVE